MKRHSFSHVREAFVKEGYKLLSNKYVNNKTSLKYICGNGHIGYIKWCSWVAGKRCPECNKINRRRRIKLNILKELKRNNFKPISIKHKNDNYIIEAICANGHKFTKTWYKWHAKYCPKCRAGLVTLDYIKEAFKLDGYTLLSGFYINSRTKLKYKCPNGHIHYITWNKWLLGRRCPYCSGKIKHTLNYIKKAFSKEGYVLLEKEYINCGQKLSYICPNGHRHSITWRNWLKGHRCPYCYGNILNLDDIDKYISDLGYTLLSDSYINNKTNLRIKCNKGHVFTRTFSNFKRNYKCPICKSKELLTGPEKLLYRIITDFADNVEIRNREIIKPFELDFVIKNKKLAIEYCGLYWHSDNKVDKYYHKTKLELCNKNNYKLIVIFEDELEDKFESVLSLLHSKLTDCYFDLSLNYDLYDLDCDSAVNFFKKYKLGGYKIGKRHKGIFYKNKLIASITYNKEFAYFCNKPFFEFRLRDVLALLDNCNINSSLYIDARFSNLNTRLYAPTMWYFGRKDGRLIRSVKAFAGLRGHIYDCGYYLVKGGFYERNTG